MRAGHGGTVGADDSAPAMSIRWPDARAKRGRRQGRGQRARAGKPSSRQPPNRPPPCASRGQG
eukprot:13469385-Alexandrium_andersonii.AAC.1